MNQSIHNLTSLVDTHCHILAGLDDGARDDDEALRMCEIAYRDGVRVIAATAHQSAKYPKNSSQAIQEATNRLAARLRDESIPIKLYSCGEAALVDTMIDDWKSGILHPLGSAKMNVLLEYPNGYPGDFFQAAATLVSAGMRPTIAHAERCAPLINQQNLVQRLVGLGCLIQVTATALEDNAKVATQRVLKSWVRAGLVHMIGSDAHDSFRRRPGLSAAFGVIAGWTDLATALRICGTQPLKLLRGVNFRAAMAKPAPGGIRGFLRRLTGGGPTRIEMSIPNVVKAKHV